MQEPTRYKNVVIRGAKFPKDKAARLDEACKILKCKKSALIVAGTLAEAERRIALLNNSGGAGQVAASAV